MEVDVQQRFAAGPDAVARAYADPALYEALGPTSRLGAPEVLDHEVDGNLVRLRIRYRFTGHLSPAARAVLDPDRLSWVEHSTHDLDRRHVDYRLVPDNYADRFRASGQCQAVPGPDDGTVRNVNATLRVRARLVGAAVERAIASGLRAHLVEEVPAVERFLAA